MSSPHHIPTAGTALRRHRMPLVAALVGATAFWSVGSIDAALATHEEDRDSRGSEQQADEERSTGSDSSTEGLGADEEGSTGSDSSTEGLGADEEESTDSGDDSPLGDDGESLGSSDDEEQEDSFDTQSSSDTSARSTILVLTADGEENTEASLRISRSGSGDASVTINEGTCDDVGSMIAEFTDLDNGQQTATLSIATSDLLEQDHVVVTSMSQQDGDESTTNSHCTPIGSSGGTSSTGSTSDDERSSDRSADEEDDASTTSRDDDENSGRSADADLETDSGDTDDEGGTRSADEE